MILLVSPIHFHIIFGGGGFPAKAQVDRPPAIVLYISVTRSQFRVAERIPIQVELSNVGQADFLVGRWLGNNQGAPFRFVFSVRDRFGNASPVHATSSHRSPGWQTLRPGGKQVYRVHIDNGTHPLLGEPGEYKIKLVYDSRRGDGKRPIWIGTVESNEIVIEVLPRK
jgi:hypothetical protein